MRSKTAAVLASLMLTAAARPAEPVEARYLGGKAGTGSAQAVVLPLTALAHTAQVLPVDPAGKIVGQDDPAAQIEQVLANLAAALGEAGSSLDQAVKVNVYVRRAALIPEVRKALARRWPGEARPATAWVETPLPHPAALVAMDAVGMTAGPRAKRSRTAAVLPAGPHVYVSGQASGGELPAATQATLASLGKTLEHLGLKPDQVVQVKAFLKPMASAGLVEKEVAQFFGGQAPPLVFVEWQDKLPIEIELIAAAPPAQVASADPIEFITPPGMEASPVYSRVTRINHGKLVYIGSVHGVTPRDAQAQVAETFAELGVWLGRAGSNRRHLAKATYYVADDEVSRHFTEYRKQHYQPARPPAASKALVAGTGFDGMLLSLDMIAVAPEYGRPAPNAADEPLAAGLSLRRAADFLDAANLHWTGGRKCGTCHTNFPYLIARPVLKEASSYGQEEVRHFFENKVSGWDKSRPGDAEVVGIAATLAIHDARTTGKLHPVTRQALDHMWTAQEANGAWDWIKCNWPPLEHDDYYGAVYAALGVSLAPEGYAAGESAKAGLAKLRRYLKTNPAPSLHHKAMLLWASQNLDGLMSPRLRESTIQELLARQRPDGGWSLATLGDWTAFDERPNNLDAPSDGYATGYVVYILRQAGVPAHDPAIQRGAAWLKSNQRQSGRWFTRSLNTDNAHYISHAGTAFAVLALKACE